MTHDPLDPGPFEILGLLSGADLDSIERRAEALSSMLKLGLTPSEGDAIGQHENTDRSAESVGEAARTLRDPTKWLREVLLWPEGISSETSLQSAADLLEGAAGKTAEPATLVRQLAHQYLTDEVNRHKPTDQPEKLISGTLTPPERPNLYLGPSPSDEKNEGS